MEQPGSEPHVPRSPASPSASVCTSSCWKYAARAPTSAGMLLVQPSRAFDLGTQPLEEIALLPANPDRRLVVQLDLGDEQPRVALRALIVGVGRVRRAVAFRQRLQRAQRRDERQRRGGMARENLDRVGPTRRDALRRAPLVRIQHGDRVSPDDERRRKRGAVGGKRRERGRGTIGGRDHRVAGSGGARQQPRAGDRIVDLRRVERVEADGLPSLQPIAVHEKRDGARRRLRGFANQRVEHLRQRLRAIDSAHGIQQAFDGGQLRLAVRGSGRGCRRGSCGACRFFTRRRQFRRGPLAFSRDGGFGAPFLRLHLRFGALALGRQRVLELFAQPRRRFRGLLLRLDARLHRFGDEPSLRFRARAGDFRLEARRPLGAQFGPQRLDASAGRAFRVGRGVALRVGERLVVLLRQRGDVDLERFAQLRLERFERPTGLIGRHSPTLSGPGYG